MNTKLKQFIKESCLNDEDKESFLYLAERIFKGKLDEFTDRSFLLEGDPGIGKTYFIKQFLSMLDIPILYLGPFQFKSSKVRRFNSLKELIEEIDKNELLAIFIDDLNNSFEFIYDGMGELKLNDSERKRFLKLLDSLKEKNSNMFLLMTLNDSSFMEEAWQDRIENEISLEEPQEKSKAIFLKEKYSSLLNLSLIKDLSKKSVGYSFRNLEDFVKLCYRTGKGIITKKIVYKMLSLFKPTGLNYEISMGNKLKFKDVIGHKNIKEELSKLKVWIKNYKNITKYGVKRSNVLIFSGKNGVGKTFMASALAGELGCMLVKVSVANMSVDPFNSINQIIKKTRKFRNCVFFIDEADKSFGRASLDLDENAVLGQLSTKFDSISSRPQGIVIFAVNNITRMGNALRDRFKIIEFNMPNLSDRQEFLQKKLEKAKELKLNITSEEIAKITEGYNYRDLEKLWDDIIFYYFDNDNFDIHVLNNLVTSQKIEYPPSMIR